MEISIAPEAVIQAASKLSGLHEVLPTGSLPPVDGTGDHIVDVGRQSLEAWWRARCTETAGDAAALHQLVTSATEAQVQRDQRAAANFANAAGPVAASLGESNPERKGRYDARGEDLPRDLNTIASAGIEGNLPEAFIGSFDYTYDLTKLNADGTAVVTITATNVTTPESATRIPWTDKAPFGPYHVPPFDKMKHLQETEGQFQPITQEITWTQTLKTR
ncbi:hypothetical protein ACRAWC_08020 [Leifsonia sp. L25]|uniref:hypothetical protein n=1 Tax=Actinomycetes TaxID=1760 RepID=UPI003D68FB05